jgi:YD repeat-containing protein
VGLPSIALVYQSLAYTAAGLLKDRIDFGNYEQRRYYGYDALLRMTCEARGQTSTSTAPTAAHCVQSSALAAGLYTYGNGQSATSPPDVRLTSFIRAEGAASTSYTSPAIETSQYSFGSSQVGSISRTGSTLTMSHDGLGRRSFEYDSFDSVRSRRDYNYLPNGQLGSISGRTPANVAYTTTIRYDERGRPLTINESLGDMYELFWDDFDRLIAANIVFPTPRPCQGAVCMYTGMRWHYHYLGDRLVAATSESVGTSYYASELFFVVTDERGLVHRLLSPYGYTRWEARWDATGTRHLVGSVPEIWVPFGLPGQIILGAQVVAYTTNIDEGAPDSVTRYGTEARAQGTGGDWTRPPIALNRWRAYDPLFGAFLQPDPFDLAGSDSPEGYLYGRSSIPNTSDALGLRTWSECSDRQHFVWAWAMIGAYFDIIKCTSGECGFPGGNDLRRKWAYAVLNYDHVLCVNKRTKGYYFDEEDGSFTRDPLKDPIGGYAMTGFTPAGQTKVLVGYFKNIKHICPKEIIAHEALHIANRGLSFGVADPSSPWGGVWSLQDGLGVSAPPPDYVDDYDDKSEEQWVTHTARECIDCGGTGWGFE